MFFLDIVIDKCIGADSKIFSGFNGVLKPVDRITLVLLLFWLFLFSSVITNLYSWNKRAQ